MPHFSFIGMQYGFGGVLIDRLSHCLHRYMGAIEGYDLHFEIY